MQCSHCILDTSDDPLMTFDSHGICSYCQMYAAQAPLKVHPGMEGKRKMDGIIDKIKAVGKNNRYDCILGLSGGVDSSYLSLVASQYGLRPLIVHFDNGWNSELAVKNIENIVRKLHFDLHTLVVDWEEFRDLQLAFIKASVIDIEMITDHAIIATMYRLAIKHNIRYILSGSNFVTEAILPQRWIHKKGDHIQIKAIQKQFVSKPFITYPLLNIRTRIRAELMGIQTIEVLNYLDFDKDKAKEELKEKLGWRDYGGKHYESVFTRFYQGYILPHKFKVDKRKAHLSTLICSGQMTREKALEEMMKPVYDESLLSVDYDFVIKKLGLTREVFEQYMALPVKSHFEYPYEKEIYKRYPILKSIGPVWRWFKSIVAPK